MYFNLKLLCTVLYRSFWKTRGTDAQLTPKRILVILILFPLYVVLELANWMGLWLDRLLFPGAGRLEVRAPVFIIGVQRSGTTFIHRLMDMDTTNFSSMKLWEIMFAPSVVQKKCFAALGKLDAALGSPLKKIVLKFEVRLFRGMADYHKNSFFAAEEDEFILVHIFASLFLITMFPFEDVFRPYFMFDQGLDKKTRAAIMAFYKRCVQNHLYAFGRDKQFLSKNPFFSGMIQSINETFPDARFICMVRTPWESVPSAISMWSACFNFFISPTTALPLYGAQREIISHYYHYPLQQLPLLPPERQQSATYPDLVSQPARTVSDIYTRFGFTMTPEFMAALQKEQEKARRYESRHSYSLEQFGLSREQMLKEYGEIFDRFGFERE
ncbi:MAG: sulfotransferase [Deltaproteobacteria bacterium]|nr:sulfotransferase [Deltaproteobacteria bacterium]